MLDKAKREHARLTANFDIDHVFNFFVTANHIRDYVENSDLVNQADIELLFQDSDMKDCRDLCDKAKHLHLTKRPDPITHRFGGMVGRDCIGAFYIGAGEVWELWSNDRHVNIGHLSNRVIEKWEAFFEAHKL